MKNSIFIKTCLIAAAIILLSSSITGIYDDGDISFGPLYLSWDANKYIRLIIIADTTRDSYILSSQSFCAKKRVLTGKKGVAVTKKTGPNQQLLQHSFL